MSIVLMGSTSGSITLSEPAVAGSNTISLPAVTGTVVVAGQNSAITAGTAVASTSGTSIDFTSIPSWVKRITVMFQGVSTSGTSSPLVQLGTSSGVTTSGYTSTSIQINNASGSVGGTSSAGFIINNGTASNAITISGHLILTLVSANIWVNSGTVKLNTANCTLTSGDVSLAATLDRVRITTVNGTDTFDAGSINILYE
jgi:hypothetical protein